MDVLHDSVVIEVVGVALCGLVCGVPASGRWAGGCTSRFVDTVPVASSFFVPPGGGDAVPSLPDMIDRLVDGTVVVTRKLEVDFSNHQIITPLPPPDSFTPHLLALIRKVPSQ